MLAGISPPDLVGGLQDDPQLQTDFPQLVIDLFGRDTLPLFRKKLFIRSGLEF